MMTGVVSSWLLLPLSSLIACTASHACPSSSYLLLGVISPPDYLERRLIIRSTWMNTLPPALCAHFAVRSGNAPAMTLRRLQLEADVHKDVLLLPDVKHDETRLRGPVLTVVAWMRHVVTSPSFAAVKLLFKVDDDTYIQTSALAAWVSATLEPIAHRQIYGGFLTHTSWYPTIFDRHGFGWTHSGAMRAKRCESNATCAQGVECGECVGAFPLASGYLIMLSRSLALALLPKGPADVDLSAAAGTAPSGSVLVDDARRLQRTEGLRTHKGLKHTVIYEDIWLGSVLHRHALLQQSAWPVTYVSIGGTGIVCDLDKGGLPTHIQRSASVVHVRTTHTRVMLGIHKWMLRHPNIDRCERALTLECNKGCPAFSLSRAEVKPWCAEKGTSATEAPSFCALRLASGAAVCRKQGMESFAQLREADSTYKVATAVSKYGQMLQRCAAAEHTTELPRTGLGRRFKSILGLGPQEPRDSCSAPQLAMNFGEIVRLLQPPPEEVDRSTPQIAPPVTTTRKKHKPRGRRLAATETVAGWESKGGALSANLQVATLTPEGALQIPPSSKIILEIGANSRDTMDLQFLPQHPDAFLLSFEPLLDKYATLLQRNSRPDRRSPLGHHHARGIVLPFAVSSQDNGVATLKISGQIDGCASLLDAVSSYFSTRCTNRSGVAEARRVPTVSLWRVMESWLPGRDVQLAKVDAQGLDVDVIQSAREHVHRLKAVQLEVVRSRPTGDGHKCNVQYGSNGKGAQVAKCDNTVVAMRQLGYVPFGTNCSVHRFNEANGCEAQMTFVRPDDFDRELVLSFCTSTWPHSCGPGAWSKGLATISQLWCPLVVPRRAVRRHGG